jgi:hypothetical protein
VFDGKLLKTLSIFIMSLLVLLAAFYWPWLSGQQSFYQSDLSFYFEPFVRFICDGYRQGRLPMWNPYLYGGMSQVAVPSPGMFYPPIACFFLPFSQGAAAFLILHQLVAGVGTFLLIVGFGWGAFAAAIAGLALALCGYMFALQANFTLVATIAWMPLLLFLLNSIDSTCSTKNILKAMGCAVTMAMMIGAGRPELSVPAALVALAFLAGTTLSDYRRHHQLNTALLKIAICLGSMFCGVLLAAPVILPALEWARVSPRSKGLELKWVLAWSANWYDCLCLICAQPVGDLTHLGNKYLNMVVTRPNTIPYLQSTYIGPLIATFAIWSLFDHRWKWRWGVVLLGLAALIMALGQNTPIAGIICNLSPALAVFRYPVKLMIFPTFAVIVMAARGAMLASERSIGRPAQIAAAVFWLAWLIFGILCLTVPALSTLPTKFPWNAGVKIDLALMKHAQLEFGQSFLIAATLGLFLSGAYLLYARSKITRRAFELIIGAVLIANLLIPAWKFSTHGTAADFYDREPTLAYLVTQLLASDAAASTDTAGQRITHRVQPLYFDPLTPAPQFINLAGLGYQQGFYLYARHMLLPNNNVDFRIPFAFGYEAAEVGQYKILFSASVTTSTQNRNHDPKKAISDAPIARFCKFTGTSIVLTQCYRDKQKTPTPKMDAKYFTQTFQDEAMNLRIFKPAESMPRAYFATALRKSNFDEFLKAMLDEHSTSMLPETFVESSFPMSTTPTLPQSSADRIKFVADEDDSVALTTTTAASQLLVLNDQFYPGWKATIDGTPSTIYRVNYFARAVWVPSGTHQIRFVYSPDSVSIGFACAGVALGTFLLAWSLGRRRRNTAASDQPATEAVATTNGN